MQDGPSAGPGVLMVEHPWLEPFKQVPFKQLAMDLLRAASVPQPLYLKAQGNQITVSKV